MTSDANYKLAIALVCYFTNSRPKSGTYQMINQDTFHLNLAGELENIASTLRQAHEQILAAIPQTPALAPDYSTAQSLLRDLDTGLLNHLVRLDTATADLLSRLGPDLRDTPEQTSAHLIRQWLNRVHAHSLDHQSAPPACSQVVPPPPRQPAGQVPPDQPLTLTVVPAAPPWSPMSKQQVDELNALIDEAEKEWGAWCWP